MYVKPIQQIKITCEVKECTKSETKIKIGGTYATYDLGAERSGPLPVKTINVKTMTATLRDVLDQCMCHCRQCGMFTGNEINQAFRFWKIHECTMWTSKKQRLTLLLATVFDIAINKLDDTNCFAKLEKYKRHRSRSPCGRGSIQDQM